MASSMLALLVAIAACSSDSSGSGNGADCTKICGCYCKNPTVSGSTCDSQCKSECAKATPTCGKCVNALTCDTITNTGLGSCTTECSSTGTGGSGGGTGNGGTGAGPSGGSGGGASGDAIAKCNALIDKWCTWAESCGQGTKAACVAEAGTALGCSAAKSVTAGYDQCMTDMNGWPCSSTTIPATCNGVILK
jgi:hypothetical protein